MRGHSASRNLADWDLGEPGLNKKCSFVDGRPAFEFYHHPRMVAHSSFTPSDVTSTGPQNYIELMLRLLESARGDLKSM